MSFVDAGRISISIFPTDAVPTFNRQSAVDAADTAESTAGQAYPLTTGTDNFTGGTGNDTFNATFDADTAATADTLTAFDSVNGGAGTDTQG